ncbi:MAG: GspH/FimT family pseudopilin [Hyphomonadaceae bacterium]
MTAAATRIVEPGTPRAGVSGDLRLGGCRGFSLLEVLVVMLVMGLAASVVMLTAPDGARNLDNEADALTRRLIEARDTALIRNRPVEVTISDAGVNSRIRTRFDWTPTTGDAPLTWVENTSVSASVLGRNRTLPVSVIFDSTGLSEPLLLTLYRNGRSAAVQVDGSGNIARMEISNAR